MSVPFLLVEWNEWMSGSAVGLHSAPINHVNNSLVVSDFVDNMAHGVMSTFKPKD